MDFSSKNVVIFGGTSGINLGIAECFVQAGAQVAVISRSQDKVDAAVKHLSQWGKAVGYSQDVRDSEQVAELCDKIAKQLGKFDVVVSGAAGNFPAPAVGMSANAFKSVVDIDLLGTFHVMQGIYPHLVKPGAAVINISAPQAYIPMQFQSHVCAAKAGVDMLTKTLAMEWGGEGVRVNSIVPGPIDNTEGMKRLAPTEQMKRMISESVPVQRLGHTHDIGKAALFLASEHASYISGVILPVDGGWSLSGVSQAMGELSRAYAAGSKSAQ